MSFFASLVVCAGLLMPEIIDVSNSDTIIISEIGIGDLPKRRFTARGAIDFLK